MRSRRIREMTALLVALALRAEAQATDGPPPPTRLWAAQTSAGQITFVWRLAPAATGYVLYRDAGGGDAQPKVATLAGNVSRYVYVVRGGGSQQAHQFLLASTDASGRASEKVAFNPVTLVTGTVAAVPPASVTATESSPGVITLKWAASPGATGYFIGKIAGASGLASVCALCPTEPTYVDSGVSNGIRYQYSVAAITPTAVSTRTMSNVVTPGVVTTAGGTGGSGGATGGTSGTGGTGGSTADTTHKTPAADPLRGRYRVSLTGFTVVSQSYDNPLQTDGKGDEVYLVTHVMKLDTASSALVVSNEVNTSLMYGDVNGFQGRVRAGTAGLTGGLATGNDFPPKGNAGFGYFPIVLWAGELVQGRNALIVVPTIWEWDNNPELFGDWLTGRNAFLTRLLQPDPIAAVLLNKDIRPVEVGSPGLYVHTNMFGDARDRPIGLKPGAPVTSAGFFGPLDAKSGTASYGSLGGQVVGAILPNNPFADFAKSLFGQVFQNVGAFASSLGTTHAHLQQPSAANFNPLGALGHTIANVRSAMLRSQQGIGLFQIAQVIMSARPSSASTDLYLFEQIIAITPEAVKAAPAQSKTAVGVVTVDVRYVDYSSLQGQYILHLKVEQIP